MSNIPEARRRLADVRNRLTTTDPDAVSEITAILNLMHRRPVIRRTPIKARPITDSVKRRVSELAATTVMPQREIAAAMGIDGGRVSEILHGDR